MNLSIVLDGCSASSPLAFLLYYRERLFRNLFTNAVLTISSQDSYRFCDGINTTSYMIWRSLLQNGANVFANSCTRKYRRWCRTLRKRFYIAISDALLL